MEISDASCHAATQPKWVKVYNKPILSQVDAFKLCGYHQW